MKQFCLFLLLLIALPLSSQVLQTSRHEVRAVWLTTLSGLDWPRKPASTQAETERQKAELCRILDDYAAIGINTVLFQTRTRSKVAYCSAIEPWDGVFSGKEGRAPLYDPLAFAIEECHRRGMELHAWVVAFPAGKVAEVRKQGAQAINRRRPELCIRAGEEWMLDPGVPATADYLAAICGEIVRNYAVDGIHLDYIRYPERGIRFNDKPTYLRYGKGKAKSQWRADNVTRCVRAIHNEVRGIRPWVKLSCAPVGKYADVSRYSSKGWNARDAVSQDVKLWLRENLMDWIFPMMYFRGNDFFPFALDWLEDSGGHPVVPGVGIYFLDSREKDWPLVDIRRELNVCRSEGLSGAAYFRSRFLTDDEKGLRDFLQHEFYRRKTLLPPMTWVDGEPPEAPDFSLQLDGQELKLSWNDVANDDSPAECVRYNIYRADSLNATLDEAVLLETGLRATEYTLMPALPQRCYACYAVTAMDVYGNESAPVFKRMVWKPKNETPMPK